MMKVVYCKNCGAKYQINDDEYVSSFECSSCAGELKFLEAYPNINNSHDFNILFPRKNKNHILVKCEECGLKYVIKENENILDYECAGCGGSLRYINPEKNKQLDKYINEQIKNKKDIIEVIRMPGKYLWNPNPWDEWHAYTFKLVYGIDPEKKLEIIKKWK